MTISLWRTTMLLTIWLLANAGAGFCSAQDDLPSLPPIQENRRSSGPTYRQPPKDLAADQYAQPADADFNAPIAANEPSRVNQQVDVRFVGERPVEEQLSRNGKIVKVKRFVTEIKHVRIAVDAKLDEIDLPPDGKRAAVLAVTAARHENLLMKLKEAESDEEKEAAVDALKTNYTEHYAIETWWREQRLAELEKRLKEMRSHVQQRQDAQEKYVAAAMTIAELWADGIAIAPPKPGNVTGYDSTTPTVIPGPAGTTITETPQVLPPGAVNLPSTESFRLQPPASLPTPGNQSSTTKRTR